MANNNTLKSDIRQYIYSNQNEEITGNILRDVLLEMVDILGDGWTYKGVATTTTNPGTPDDNVFYIATAPGTYTNFGSLSVADGEVAILKYNGSWAKDVTGAATSAQVTQLGQDVEDVSEEIGGVIENINYAPASVNLIGGFSTKYLFPSGGKFINDPTVRSIAGQIEPGKTYTIDQKTTGNRFICYFSEVEPAANVVYTSMVSFTGYQTGTLTAGENDHYLLIYIQSTNTDVDYSGYRIYEGTTYRENSVSDVNLVKQKIDKIEQNTVGVGINRYKAIADSENGLPVIVSSAINWAVTNPLIISKLGGVDAITCRGYTTGNNSFAGVYDINMRPLGCLYRASTNFDYQLSSLSEDLTPFPDAYYIRFCVDGGTYSDDTIGFVSEAEMLTTKDSFRIFPDFDFVLPKYIDCPVGMQTNIFIDTIHTAPDSASNLISYVGTNKISCAKKILRVNMESGDSNIPVTFYKTNENLDVLKQQGTTLRKVARTGGGGATWNICVSGSSNIDNTAQAPELFRLLAADGDIVVNQIGTYTYSYDGVTYRHEGRGGWSWGAYINPTYENTELAGKTNAFMYGGKLDFAHYMSANFPTLSGIDIFVMNLGTNDVTQGVNLQDGNSIRVIVNRAKTFIDALLNDYPNCKVVIGMPTIGAPVQNSGDRRAIIYKKSIQLLNKAYIDTFDDGAYNGNVLVCPFTIFANREVIFPHTDVVIDPTYQNVVPGEDMMETLAKKARMYSDMIHCTVDGYRSWGAGLYRTVRSVIDGLY